MYQFYVVQFTLAGYGEDQLRCEYIRVNKPSSEISLKKKMFKQLKDKFPESEINGGDRYFNIKRELFQVKLEGKQCFPLVGTRSELMANSTTEPTRLAPFLHLSLAPTPRLLPPPR